MSKIWKRILGEGETEIRYIENKFLNSFGSVGKCGSLNCSRSTAKIQVIRNSQKFNDFYYLCEICSAEKTISTFESNFGSSSVGYSGRSFAEPEKIALTQTIFSSKNTNLSLFGTPVSDTNFNGTTQKFMPLWTSEFDCRMNSKIINMNCYSAMYHAKSKSLEELRIEDYTLCGKIHKRVHEVPSVNVAGQKETDKNLRWIQNDSTFKCPASECTAVNQSFDSFVNAFCCKENIRQKEDSEKYQTMIMRAADYGRTCEAKNELENKITVKEQAAKRARESIEAQQKKLKDAELEIKRLKTDFVKLRGEVDAKKRKLEEEMTVVIASPPQQLAIEASPEEAVNPGQEKLAKINNSDATGTRNPALLAIKTET